MADMEEVRPAVPEAAPAEEGRPAEPGAPAPALPRPRSMTRAEFKAFRAAGVDPALARKSGGGADQAELLERNEAMVDWILQHIYPDTDFDQASNAECMRLARDTYALSMGVSPEELTKNS